jgi:flagellar basal-body rod protein FlgB
MSITKYQKEIMDNLKRLPTLIPDANRLQPVKSGVSAQDSRAAFESILSNLGPTKNGSVLPSSPAPAARAAGGAAGGLFDLFSGQAKPKFHERALGLRAYRQEMLASNIANADTPGYKAVDIDVNTAIKSGGSADSGVEPKYEVQSQGAIDGNTVDMDIARQKFAENALMYEYELDRVKGFYKSMSDLLSNTPY